MEKLNSAGYPDPTANTAIARILRDEKNAAYRPVVYIASPFAGETTLNTKKAQSYCKFAVAKGAIPLAPHLHYPQFMDDSDKTQRELGIRFALILLGKCEELWVFGDTVSEGMSREIAKAKRRGMPIRYFNHKCEEVLQSGDQENRAGTGSHKF
jgi:hypothetical protein